MQPRQIAIVAAVVVIGFLAAFGIAKAAGGQKEEPTASPSQPAEVIEVAPVEVAAGAPPAGNLPSLKVPEPKPEPTTEPSTPTEPAPAPTTAPAPAPTTAPAPAPTTAPVPTPVPTAAPAPTIQQGGGGVQQGGSD